MRTRSVKDRMWIDLCIKNFIQGILNIRKELYEQGILTCGKSLTKDSDSGKGKNSYL